MEHQLVPRGSSVTFEDRVPYIGSKDYLDVSFLDYPSHAGYAFLVQSPITHVDLAKLKTNPPTVDFVQNWLFFGWLREVLETFVKEVAGTELYEHEDLLQRVNTPARSESSITNTRGIEHNSPECSIPQLITTTKLNELLETWRDIIQPEVPCLETQYLRLWTNICIFENFLSSFPSELPVRHKLSICSTIEAIELCIDDACVQGRSWVGLLEMPCAARSEVLDASLHPVLVEESRGGIAPPFNPFYNVEGRHVVGNTQTRAR